MLTSAVPCLENIGVRHLPPSKFYANFYNSKGWVGVVGGENAPYVDEEPYMFQNESDAIFISI